MKSNDSHFTGYNSAGSKDVGIVKDVSTVSSHSVPETSTPNSVKIKIDKNGQKKSERYYNKDGKAYLDIDYTDHGNMKSHPIVPHQHKITWNNGKMKRENWEEINK